MKSSQKGFTLIELLVTISIIGLLSTMAVFSLNSARTKARDAKRMSDMKMLSTAMEIYASDKGTYVDGFTGCAAKGHINSCDDIMYAGDVLLSTASLKDPADVTDVCVFDSASACEYHLFENIEAGWDWSVCFYLEKGAGIYGSGMHAIGPGGVVVDGDTDHCRD